MDTMKMHATMRWSAHIYRYPFKFNSLHNWEDQLNRSKKNKIFTLTSWTVLHVNPNPQLKNLCVLWLVTSWYNSSYDWTNRTAKIVCKKEGHIPLCQMEHARDTKIKVLRSNHIVQCWMGAFLPLACSRCACSWVTETPWLLNAKQILTLQTLVTTYTSVCPHSSICVKNDVHMWGETGGHLALFEYVSKIMNMYIMHSVSIWRPMPS
jgi:hypothetical protein